MKTRPAYRSIRVLTAVVFLGMILASRPPRADAAIEKPTSAEPTDEETLMLEMINRFRANPAAEADRIRKQSASIGAIKQYKVDVAMMHREISALAPTAPLVMDLTLIKAARSHANYLIVNSTGGHTQQQGRRGFTGAQPSDRALAAGHRGRGTAECVANGMRDVRNCLSGYLIDWGPGGEGGMQAGRGHRKILSTADMRQIGVGNLPKGDRLVNVCNLSGGSAPRYVGGVAYRDRNRNGLYDIGEGVGGVGVTASDGSATRSFKSGAYTLALRSTNAIVIAFDYQGDRRSMRVVAGGENVKIDWRPTSAKQRTNVSKLLADVGRVRDKKSKKYTYAVAKLYVATRGATLDDTQREKVETLTKAFGVKFEAAQRVVLGAMGESREAFAVVLAAQYEPYRDTLASLWFRDAATYFNVLELDRRLREESAKKTTSGREKDRRRVIGAWRFARRKARTDDFRNRLDKILPGLKKM